MQTIQAVAVDMAATYHGDFAMIGVSNYLGGDAYQIVRGSPRAMTWVDRGKISNPRQHIAARLQAYVTGTEAGLVNSGQAKVDSKSIQY